MDERAFRPITFEGETFPPSLMGISVAEYYLPQIDEATADWLWRLPICCGFTKSAPAARCHEKALRVVALMKQNRDRLVRGIAERFDDWDHAPEAIFAEWIDALERIAQLAQGLDRDCEWSAPGHPDDPIQSAADVERLMDATERWAERSDG